MSTLQSDKENKIIGNSLYMLARLKYFLVQKHKGLIIQGKTYEVFFLLVIKMCELISVFF